MATDLQVQDPVLTQPKPDVVDVAATVEIVKRVTALTSEDDYVSVAKAWTVIREKADEIAAWFKPRKAKAREVYEQMLADERELTKPLDEALAHARSLMSAYSTEAHRRAQVTGAQAQVKAVQQETAKILEEAQVLADAGVALNDPELQFQAHEMLERATRPGGLAVPARTEPVTPVVDGMRTKDVWTPAMNSKGEALAFVAEHPEYWDLFDMNEAYAKALAKLYQARLNSVIPGMSATMVKIPIKAKK